MLVLRNRTYRTPADPQLLFPEKKMSCALTRHVIVACNSTAPRCSAAAGSPRPQRQAGNADASRRRSDQSPKSRAQEAAGGAAAGKTISIITGMESVNRKHVSQQRFLHTRLQTLQLNSTCLCSCTQDGTTAALCRCNYKDD